MAVRRYPGVRLPGQGRPRLMDNNIIQAYPQSQSTASASVQTNVVVQGTGGGGSTTPTNLGGDVTGPSSANRITSIQGVPLSLNTPLAPGKTYVMVNGYLVPSSLAGDCQGSLVGNIVARIRGARVAAQTPIQGDTLFFTAGKYYPTSVYSFSLDSFFHCI